MDPILDSLRPKIGGRYSTTGLDGEVISWNGHLAQRVTWADPKEKNSHMCAGDPYVMWTGIYHDSEPEVLTLPAVYLSMEQLQNRELDYQFQEGAQSLEIFSRMIFGLQTFGLLQAPRLNTRIMAKVWNDRPHGTEQKARYLSVDDAYVTIKHLQAANHNPESLNSIGRLTAAFCWDIEVSNDYGRSELILPIADLEVPYDDTPRLERVARILSKNGFSGSLIRSGDFTHYMADFFLPKKYSAKVIAKLMSILTPCDDFELQEYAHALYVAKSSKRALQAAQAILERYPSGSPTSSDLDIRWASHIFAHNNGHASLRCLTAKRYRFNPYEVAKIS